MRAAVLLVVLAVGCGKKAGVDVICYPAKSNGWSFDCVVTGNGEPTAHEQFSSHDVHTIRGQGNDPTRTFRGTRWTTTVVIEKVGSWGGVTPGKEYTFYGTVESVTGDRIVFTDCLFAPAP